MSSLIVRYVFTFVNKKPTYYITVTITIVSEGGDQVYLRYLFNLHKFIVSLIEKAEMYAGL